MRRALTLALLILASVPLLYAVAQLPPVGSVENPAITHVAPHYLVEGPEETGCENIVTAVILNYRGYDTDGEVTVIFAAMMAVFGVLLLPRASENKAQPDETTPVSPVTRFIVRTLAPFIVIFAVYMVIYGHATPGGGFQGGVILAAAFFIPLLARPGRALDQSLVSLIEGLAGAVFILIGLLAMFGGDAFLTPLLGEGRLGALFSAGTLPILYMAVGLKVGAELAGLLAHIAANEAT